MLRLVVGPQGHTRGQSIPHGSDMLDLFPCGPEYVPSMLEQWLNEQDPAVYASPYQQWSI